MENGTLEKPWGLYLVAVHIMDAEDMLSIMLSRNMGNRRLRGEFYVDVR